MKKPITKGISIIICCFNSAKRLPETLNYLAKQNLPEGIACEVLIINNASNDNTSEVALNTWQEFRNPYPIRIINESNPGLSFARKKGINESQYDLILFCDDDNHLFPDYINNGYKLMISNDQLGIVGGISLPKLEHYPGKWIEDMYGALAISGSHIEEGYSEWVFGAGMFIRKKIFEDLKKRNIELQLTDRVGKKQTSGGDTEICFYTRFLGYKVWTSKKLKFHHFINKNRLNKLFFIKGNFRNIYPSIYLYILNNLIADKTMKSSKLYLKYLALRIRGIFYFFPRLILGRHKFYSFLMIYQDLQITVGLLFRWRHFFRYYKIIKQLINE